MSKSLSVTTANKSTVIELSANAANAAARAAYLVETYGYTLSTTTEDGVTFYVLTKGN